MGHNTHTPEIMLITSYWPGFWSGEGLWGVAGGGTLKKATNRAHFIGWRVSTPHVGQKRRSTGKYEKYFHRKALKCLRVT